MSIIDRPASSAASRATLPWLWPWRTSHIRSGQFWRMFDLLQAGESLTRLIVPHGHADEEQSLDRGGRARRLCKPVRFAIAEAHRAHRREDRSIGLRDDRVGAGIAISGQIAA